MSKKLITICLITVFVFCGMFVTGCKSKSESESFVQKTFEISVNQRARIREAGWNTIRRYLIYNGMNTEKTFSISDATDHIDYTAVNTYYPITLKELNWYECKFRVDLVNSEKLVITLIGYN